MFLSRIVFFTLIIIQFFTSYCFSTVTIEIFSELKELSPSQNKLISEEGAQQIPKPYDTAFGKGTIFDYHPTEDPQESFINIVQRFEEAINSAGVSQNYIIVGVRIGPCRSILQHIFFSGNVESVRDNLFLNIEDLKEQFNNSTAAKSSHESTQLPQDKCNNRALMKKTFLKEGEPTAHARTVTLECLIQDYFKQSFFNTGKPEFLMFPVHQASLITSKGSHKADEHKVPVQVDYSDSITCEFREFIYSYFSNLADFSLNDSQKILLQVTKNITTHANHHSASQAIQTIQEKILKAAFLEIFVRNNDHAINILTNIYGEESFDNVFGHLTEEPQQSLKESRISDCFQHSEQAFLKAIDRSGLSMREFILEYFSSNFQSDHSAWNALKKEATNQPSTVSAEELQSVNDDDIEQGKGIPVEKSFVPQATIDILEFIPSIPIVLDIFSPRHICKFCRGSIHLMYPKILKLFEGITLVEDAELSSGNPKTIKRAAKKLVTPVVEKKCPGNDELKFALKEPDDLKCLAITYEYCLQKRNSDHYCKEFKDFIETYQNHMIYDRLKKIFPNLNKNLTIKLKNIDLYIYATSFKETKEELMGITKAPQISTV